MRSRYGLTLLAVQRGEAVITNPAAETIIRAEDRLVVLAEQSKLTQACHLFLGPMEGDSDECPVPDHHEYDPAP